VNSRYLATCLLLILCSAGYCAAGRDEQWRGRLVLNTDRPLIMEVLRDDYGLASAAGYKARQLPHFAFTYVEHGGHLIPARRGTITGSHPLWEFILEPGRISRTSTDPDSVRISLPFALQERNANCMHNGSISFSMLADGSLSPIIIEIASETCLYFKFDLKGALTGSYQARPVTAASDIIAAFDQRRKARLAVRPMAALAERYPRIDLAVFAGKGKLSPADNTVYGFVLDDQHYRSECMTRRGLYPFCDELSLPSYSLAKSLFAGVAAMRLEKLYPGSMNRTIADSVPRCREGGTWENVTLEQALNMVTGNFSSAEVGIDENSRAMEDGFFRRYSHGDRLAFCCDAWPRRAAPGSRMVYHSSDTYLLGTAMSALLREKLGPTADVYDDLLRPLWRHLHLGPALGVVRRSYDDHAQPLIGYGMTLLTDDIARLARALNKGDFASELDERMYLQAMQRFPVSRDAAPAPAHGKYAYRHGFWALREVELPGCSVPLVIPFMSGFGGINVVMMPNDTVFYTFNDGGFFAFSDVVSQSHSLRSMCPRSPGPPAAMPQPQADA
jgi:hypothetical protein